MTILALLGEIAGKQTNQQKTQLKSLTSFLTTWQRIQMQSSAFMHPTWF